MKKKIENVTLFQIDKTNKMVRQYSQREFDKLKLGITVDQWVILKIVEEHKELSQKSIAEFSMRNPASITRTLDLLEKKGLVSREPTAGDRRQYIIILTKEGKIFVEQHLPLINEHRSRSVKGFNREELKQLSNFLLRIQENMA